jgi:hypothetical protein
MMIPPVVIKNTKKASGTSQWRNAAVQYPWKKAMPPSSYIIKEDERPSRGGDMSA